MMAEGRMMSEARICAAVALEEVDRVALGHSIDSFAARYAGISQEAWWFDHAQANAALLRTYHDLGPWDTNVSFAPGHPLAFALTAPMRVKLPGRDLAPDEPMQFEELELMTAEDYDLIVARGWDAFLEEFFPRLGIDPRVVPVAQAAIARHGVEDGELWRDLGVHMLCGTKLRLPYDWFSYARSLTGFVLDLFRRPQQVIAAMDAALPAMLAATRAKMQGAVSNGVFMPMARGATTFISPRQFEQFCFPWIQRAVEALVAEGYVPVLHCDADWTALLPYFRELPPRRCILQLDEQTDIVKAKEILGDHMCLYGNVAPALLSLGGAEEVEAHCRRLVEVVGEGGGFILGPACTMPMDAKAENVRAMTRAVLG
jgi:hypothetical protein